MRRTLAGILAGFIIGSAVPAVAGIDDYHPRHERMAEAICAHPRHFERGHGITIISEGCDR